MLSNISVVVRAVSGDITFFTSLEMVRSPTLILTMKSVSLSNLSRAIRCCSRATRKFSLVSCKCSFACLSLSSLDCSVSFSSMVVGLPSLDGGVSFSSVVVGRSSGGVRTPALESSIFYKTPN